MRSMAPIHDAAEAGDSARLSSLLNDGADPNTKDRWCKTALMWASRKGHRECMELLITKGADLNEKDIDGETALMKVSTRGSRECMELLITKGADLNETDDHGWTAFMCASAAGRRECMEELLSNGAGAFEKDSRGQTALMQASVWGHRECMELLIDMGENVNEKDNNGKTALMLASERMSTERRPTSGAVRLLMTNGANLDEKDNDGKTALMYASNNGNRGCVGLLVANGARLDEKNLYGYTACDVATGRCKDDLLLHAQRQEAIRTVLSARFAARLMTDDAFLAVLVDKTSRMAYSPAKTKKARASPRAYWWPDLELVTRPLREQLIEGVHIRSALSIGYVPRRRAAEGVVCPVETPDGAAGLMKNLATVTAPRGVASMQGGADDTLGTCSICNVREPETRFMDCGHACVCDQCAMELLEQGENCPVCSTEIRDVRWFLIEADERTSMSGLD